MPVSTMTSKGQTTVPKEVRGGKVAITTERPALYDLQGFIKHGPEARKTRGRV